MATLNAPKLINVNFNLASGNFSGSGGNTYSATGLRIQAHIDIKGGLQQAHASVAVYGLPLQIMNQLVTVGKQYPKQFPNNGMEIDAGDNNGMSLVFKGNMFNTYIDGQNQPQVCLRAEGQPGNYWNVKPAQPLSFQGATKATTIAQKIASSMGMGLIDLGVKTVLSNPYFPSDAMTQLHKLAEHCNFGYVVDGKNVTIWPPGGNSGGNNLISPQTGMVGYPLFDSRLLKVKCIFNPNIKVASTVNVQSSITAACGSWFVQEIEYELESKTPHGKWFMTITGQPTDDITSPQT